MRNAPLESIVLWCLPDYASVATVVAVQDVSGFLPPFEPLPTAISDVRAYLQCLGSRQSITPRLEQAWNCFYRQYKPLVGRVSSMSCHTSQLDDISQEIWMEIVAQMTKLADGHIRGDFSSWLVGLTLRQAGRTARREALPLAQEPSPIESLMLASPDLGPDDECLVKEMCGQLDNALAELRRRTSSENYEVFYRRLFLGEPFKKIAAALGLTSHEVRWRYHRLKRKWQALTKRLGLSNDGVSLRDSPLPRKPR